MSSEKEQESLKTSIITDKTSLSFNNYILSNIDNINFHLERSNPEDKKDQTLPSTVSKSYSNISFALILTLILVNLSYFNYNLSANVPSNSIYCFQTTSYRFVRCSLNEFCESFESKYVLQIYTKDYSLINEDPQLQLNAVNDKYAEIFTKILFYRFLSSNYDMLNPHRSYSKQFKGAIVFAHYNRYTTNVRYVKYCKESADVQFTLIFMTIILCISNLFVPLMADIFGRKSVLLASACILSVGLLCYYVILEVVDAKIEVFKGDESSFESEYTLTRSSHEEYKLFNIYYYISLFLQLTGAFALENVTLPLMIESAVSEASFSKVVFLNQIIKLFSFCFSLFASIQFEHMKYNNLATFCLSVVVIVLLIAFQKESPRFLFEMSDWRKLTEYYMPLKTDKLVSLYFGEGKLKEIEQFEKEKNAKLKKKVRILSGGWNAKIAHLIAFNSVLVKHKQNLSQILLKQDDLVYNPFIIYSLLAIDRERFSEMKTIFANIVVRIVNNHLLHFSLTSIYFLDTREQANKIYIHSWILALFLVCLFGLTFFYYLMKFVKHKKIYFICLFALVLITAVLQINTMVTSKIVNMGISKFTLADEGAVRDRTLRYKILLISYTFFTLGMNLTMSNYLQTLPKTLYRCTFNGIFLFVDNLLMFVVRYLSLGFQNYFLAFLAVSFVGIGCATFLHSLNVNYVVAELKKFENTEGYELENINKED